MLIRTISFRIFLIVLLVFVTACERNASELNVANDYILASRGREIRADLSPRIEQLIKEHGIPSITVVAFDQKKIIWAEAFGKANIAQGANATLETVYTTGSTFKIIVATAVMQLVEAGKIDLDDPINAHLSEPIADFSSQGRPLTIRHLLAHRSGLKNARKDGAIDIWSRSNVPSLKAQINQLRSITNPGEKYEYCNVCFLLFADMIQNITGQEFEEYLRDNILIPVGSQNTAPLYPDATMAEMMAFPYEQIGGRSYPVAQKFLDTLEAGDTYLRPLDMATFLQIHLEGGQSVNKKVLSNELIHMMREVQFSGNTTLGFSAVNEGDVQVLYWAGGTRGGSTLYELEPFNGVGIYIASNSHNTQKDLRDITRRVRDLLRNADKPHDYEIEHINQIAPLTITREDLSAYTGTYVIEAAGVEMAISILSNGLALTNPAGERIRLVMLSNKDAALIGTGERITFSKDQTGKISSLKLRSGNNSFLANKTTRIEKK